MRCAEINDLLDLYVEGELAEEAAARVERHLLRCPDCAYLVRGLEQTRAYLRAAFGTHETSPGFRERAAARLEDELADLIHRDPATAEGQRMLPFFTDR